jgi:enoyl-CoA hydratase/carnithine racemase
VVDPHVDDRAIVAGSQNGDAGDVVTECVSLPLEEEPVGSVLRGRIVTPEVALELGLVHEVVDNAPARALELADEIASLPPMSVANAKRALALGSFLAVDPASRRDWFESASSLTYPAYSGH